MTPGRPTLCAANRGVTGLDSTAARSFSTLVLTLSSQHVNVIFANVRRPDVRQLLAANGLPLVPYAVLPYAGAGGERDGGDASAGGAWASNGEGAAAAPGTGGGGGKPVDEEQGVPQPDAEAALARECWAQSGREACIPPWVMEIMPIAVSVSPVRRHQGARPVHVRSSPVQRVFVRVPLLLPCPEQPIEYFARTLPTSCSPPYGTKLAMRCHCSPYLLP